MSAALSPAFSRAFLLAGTGPRLDGTDHENRGLLLRQAGMDVQLEGPNLACFGDFAGSTEAAAYRRFARESQRIFDTLDHSFMRREKPSPVALSLSLGVRGMPRLYATKPFTSLWQELGRLFKDPRLQQLFGRYATYCGSSPFDAPATLMLIAHAERAGVWIIDGGMHRLAQAMAGLAIA